MVFHFVKLFEFFAKLPTRTIREKNETFKNIFF